MGRPKGSVNYPKAQHALMRATSFPKNRGKTLTAISAMRSALAEASALASTARKAGDASAYRVWSQRVVEIARDLAPYETPKLSATLTSPVDTSRKLTDFVLTIFDKPRSPPVRQIEATATEVSPPADTVAADPTPGPKPAEPEATPPASPSDDDAPAPGPSWSEPKSLWTHPSMLPGRCWPWPH